mmetsp:Transcript_10246/g.17132  ORF Transcript_10246/g.17132 Transcript_10246/m.17132 type:complete len:395 (-) Transcript_10246:204-1388(-)
MWSSKANTSALIEDFAAAVEADNPSKGSFQDDYTEICSKYSVIPCPNIKAAVGIMDDFESCRIINCMVDLSSWRAMLLACCTMNAKVVEISVHGCPLSIQHIKDLALALNKIGTCQSLKLQYVEFGINEENQAEYQDALRELMKDTMGLEYLSLKGNALTDEFIAPFIQESASNFKLTTLNLSENSFTDATVKALCAALKFNTSLQWISLQANKCTGEFLAELNVLLNGAEITPDEDAHLKSIGKMLGDKNKAIKDVNKKRKKAGVVELPELAAWLDCTVKREKTVFVANRSLKRLDFSDSPSLAGDLVEKFRKDIAAAAATAEETGVAMPPAATATASGGGGGGGDNDDDIPALLLDLRGSNLLNTSATATVGNNEQVDFAESALPPWIEILL